MVAGTRWIAWRRTAICMQFTRTHLTAPSRYMKRIEIDIRMFNYASGKRGGCGEQSLMVSGLLCLLGQFFALWPDTPLQGSLRSALKVDELTIILAGCMRACGSTSPRMTARPSRVLSTPCGVVDCIILREVVCSLAWLGSFGLVNRAR